MLFKLKMNEKMMFDNNESKTMNSKIVTHENVQIRPNYQHTCCMTSQSRFKTDPVDKIVTSVVNSHLNDIICNDEETAKICSNIASEIRRNVKKLKFDRYKIIVIVTIIEKASQSLETSFGCLWDSKRDHYSMFSMEGRTFYAHCCVFGLYYE